MKNLKRKRLFLLLVFALAIFLVAGEKGKNLDRFAEKILKTCSKDEWRPGCYDREIPKLLEKGRVTMEEAFSVTEKIQSKDKVYLYCHILGHKLADIETKKDLSKWLDVIARCPVLSCNSGCPHGAALRRFKGSEVLTDSEIEEILPELKIACEPKGDWNPNDVERYMCYHGAGHLAMYITGANIDRSLEICKKFGVKDDGADYYQTCTQGVFMIVYQGLDPEDKALVAKIKPEKENVPAFCRRFKGLEFIACRTEAWILFLDEFKDPLKVVDFCAFTGGGFETQWCYATSLVLVPLEILNTEGVAKVADYCLAMPKDKQEPCFAIVATTWVQDEPGFAKDAIALCKMAEEKGLSEICYHDLLFFSKWSFKKDTDEWRNYCSSFSEPQKSACFSGNVPDDYFKWGK